MTKLMVAVLFATYNGGRFLKEQLDSLLAQSYQDFIVYVHDDGSHDDTMEIIEEYMKRYQSKFIYLTDNVTNRGAKESFMWLLDKVQAEYYMFCDQDDVWKKNKIEVSLDKIRELEKLNPGKPAMVHTDLTVVDSNLEVLYDSFWQWKKYNVDLNRNFNYSCIHGNVFTGCTMIINDFCKRKALPFSQNVNMHDHWLGLVACKNGCVDNIKSSTILYRQHENNVCSAWSRDKREYGVFKRMLTSYHNIRPLLKELEYGSFGKYLYYKIRYRLHILLLKVS